MNERRRLGLLMALLVLGAVSAFAALQITNVTIWAINATAPPVQKYAGADVAAYPDNIKVESKTQGDGLNVTYIYILGYTGDITNYTDALRVCNKHSNWTVNVWIEYRGPVADTAYDEYVKQFMVYKTGNRDQWVGFTYIGSTQNVPVQQNGPLQIATLAPDQCATLEVSVLVSGDLPPEAWRDKVGTAVPPTTEDSLAVYQINIITTPT